jgi:hypothetical protein
MFTAKRGSRKILLDHHVGLQGAEGEEMAPFFYAVVRDLLGC